MQLNELETKFKTTCCELNFSPAHNPNFVVSVEVNGYNHKGHGNLKQLAKQMLLLTILYVGGDRWSNILRCSRSKIRSEAKASAARSVLSNLYKVSYNMQGLSQSIPNSFDAELYNFPQAVADTVSKLLLSTFKEIMTGNAEHAKWKIIAGVAMTTDEAMEDIKVISFATGLLFYTNLEYHITGQQGQSIFLKKENGGFRLKPQIKFHLYISTAPCGDARIFCPHEEEVMKGMDRHPNRNSRGVLRTKIESGEGTIPIRSGQSIQTWDGILPGQERLLTMSCSDKIASWNVLGLQGALLSHFIEPIYLDSVILGGLFHPNHLHRALFGRFENSIEDLPPSFKINKPKMCVISSPETRHLAKSPNFSVNWTTGLERAEIVNAITGKTEGNEVSRLAKRAFFQRFLNIYNRIPHITDYETPKQGMYVAYKNVVKHYQEAKKALALAFTKADLGNWVKKPIEQNEFELR
ncbi:double-stranded RNA-specific editase 1 [Caerostris extrusa]|uniref:Double-stranded RNA-specific editase 1 n=1 Tax=Caerostris extrusa TaxID=172846 RepID=A0AAV4MIK4_CAEEX|nr:double-stranded RNA-specific editase 1 [Caerostris extrusa]